MPEESARFALPLLVPGQAEKEVYHNEALARIDAALHASVVDGPTTAPPAAPSVGQCWIVGSGAGGDWTGRDASLAAWTGGGWRFVPRFPACSPGTRGAAAGSIGPAPRGAKGRFPPPP